MHTPCAHHAHTMHTPCTYHACTTHIPCIHVHGMYHGRRGRCSCCSAHSTARAGTPPTNRPSSALPRPCAMASEGGEMAASRRTAGSRSSNNRRSCSDSNPSPNPNPSPDPNLDPNLKQAQEVAESRHADRLPPELSAQGSEVTLALALALTLTLIRNHPLTLTLTRPRRRRWRRTAS